MTQIRPGAAIITTIYRGLAPPHLDWIGDVVDDIAEAIDTLAHPAPWTEDDDAALAALAERLTATISHGMREAITAVAAHRSQRAERRSGRGNR